MPSPRQSIGDPIESRSLSPSRQDSTDNNTPSHPLLPSHQNQQHTPRPSFWHRNHTNGHTNMDREPEPKPTDYGAYHPEGAKSRTVSFNNTQQRRTDTEDTRATHRQSSSWDILNGIRHSYVDFDPRHANQDHLVFAEGDIPKNAFYKLYNYLINVSIVTRWFIFIVPVLGLLWIPGIIGLTAYKDATIWGIKLVWWSIWLTVVWCGWWGARAVTMLLPFVARSTIGVVAVGARRYIEWLYPLQRYIALFGWSLTIWIAFQPLVTRRRESDISTNSQSALSVVAKLLFALFESALILLGEKVAIQYIATKFHERSYAERVAVQKFAVRTLVTLYRNSSDIPWRADTLNDAEARDAAKPRVPKRILKRAIQGVRFAATTTTTALGNVASEIAGTSVLQPNSPQAVIKTALGSANKSRMLARRLFYSFVKPGKHALELDDIARFFPTAEDAEAAFALFDKDTNGDATRDEVEIGCIDCHREQLSIEHSMRDLDSAVGRLDNILMTVWVLVVILLLAVAVDTEVSTLVTSASTFVLGLSWLIGTSFVEVLTSIIFLFVKHPYDVGDRIAVDGVEYIVKEMRLLSTVMLDGGSCSVQAPHSVLNTKLIQNMRRSPQMSETFTFDVAYGTTFKQIEHLRELMLAFVQSESRDFLPSFDISIDDIPEQTKMTLSAPIKYKSNCQQGALKATRRNKWISALKQAMLKVKMYGPTGDPSPPPEVERVTLVPWEQVEEEEKKKKEKEKAEKEKKASHRKTSTLQEVRAPTVDWMLTDHDAIIMDDTKDIFDDDASEASMSDPSRSSSTEPLRRPPGVQPTTSTPSPLTREPVTEEIEMTSTPQRMTPEDAV